MSWWDEKDKYLWQAMGKENLDPDNKASEKEWALFIEQYADAFAEDASQFAQECWNEYRAFMGMDE